MLYVRLYKKKSFIFRKILVCFLAGNTYWYTKDQPTFISGEKSFTFNY